MKRKTTKNRLFVENKRFSDSLGGNAFLLNKKGFTLIELLAVIVILAIILLIATPMILGTISKARKGAFQNSAYGLMKAAENEYMFDQIEGQSNPTIYEFQANELIQGKLDYRGETPKFGQIVVGVDGRVAIALSDGTWCALKGANESKISVIEYNESTCIIDEEVYQIVRDKSGANPPVLLSGMTPIKFNGLSEVTTTANDPEWYDYDAKKWANAQTIDGSYWVWIPRYAYKITSGYHSNETGTIDIKFLKNKTNIAVDNTTIETSDYNVGVKNTSQYYFLHPAFTFGEDDVAGFWVAKFEPSVANQNDLCYTDESTNNCNKDTLIPKIIPNAKSWRYIQVENIYKVALNMKNTIGLSNADTHMMKNTEWGAVAYLSKSKYGAHNEEVYINNSSTYITGNAGNTVDAASAGGTTNAWNIENGVKASTTHNITGVYDMSGGAWEYTAAYINNDDAKTNGQIVVNANGKYKDVYIEGVGKTQESNYEANKNEYGDAVYEISTSYTGSNSWYEDYSYMPSSSSPWFRRGGRYSNAGNAGVFAFNDLRDGSAHSSHSWRPVAFFAG